MIAVLVTFAVILVVVPLLFKAGSAGDGPARLASPGTLLVLGLIVVGVAFVCMGIGAI